MKKLLIVAFVAGLIGFVAGNAFWYLASPLWIDRVVSENQPAVATSRVLAAGDVTGVDFVHKGAGKASILQTAEGTVVRFTEFEVTNGPDLKVYLVKHDNPRSNSDVTDSDWVSLGSLKGNVGDQNYSIPGDIDSADFGSVVIWCEPFGVLFAGASLTPQS
ncbi:MAG: DM13 domain-containing protein [Alphaproteobacteria bacterium]